jgi:hypothetical protein
MMDDLAFLALLRRVPFGTCSDSDWAAFAERLLGSLARFIGMPLEFVGSRRPDGDSFVPLVRSVGELLPAVGIRLAGMISCSTPNRTSGLQVYALLFLFAGTERVSPPGLQFFTCDYLGPGDGSEWVWRGWGTSDFPEEWDPYTFRRYFCGAESQLPGCGPEEAL